MKQYLDLGKEIIEQGRYKLDRTGVGCYSLFGRQIRFDLNEGFPLVTTKKMFTRGIIEELLWFLKGSTDNTLLKDKEVHIWDKWELKKEDIPVDRPDLKPGDTGPIYGKQWRKWQGNVKTAEPIFTYSNPDVTGGVVKVEYDEIDQIAELIHNLKTFPFSRRHVVTAWNPTFMPTEADSPEQNIVNGKACLASCHCMFQFYVEELSTSERWVVFERSLAFNDAITVGMTEKELFQHAMRVVPEKRLSCLLFQRSCDYPAGACFNIASYALLTHMIAQCVGMGVGDFVYTLGDVHVYSDQVEKFKMQLTREPLPLPTLWLDPKITNIDDFTIDSIRIVNYQSHEKIEYAIAK